MALVPFAPAAMEVIGSSVVPFGADAMEAAGYQIGTYIGGQLVQAAGNTLRERLQNALVDHVHGAIQAAPGGNQLSLPDLPVGMDIDSTSGRKRGSEQTPGKESRMRQSEAPRNKKSPPGSSKKKRVPRNRIRAVRGYRAIGRFSRTNRSGRMRKKRY